MFDKDFQSQTIKVLNKNWKQLLPYLETNKVIQTPDELLSYYEILVNWWSAMTTVVTVPDKENSPSDFKEKILMYRGESEKYTEKMNKVFTNYWSVSKYPELVSVLLPKEASEIAKGKVSANMIKSLHNRLEGCFLYNQTVYPLADLDRMLSSAGVQLEDSVVDNVLEIKGTPACRGKGSGVVQIIAVLADASKTTRGDILVTQMTNPGLCTVYEDFRGSVDR